MINNYRQLLQSLQYYIITCQCMYTVASSPGSPIFSMHTRKEGEKIGEPGDEAMYTAYCSYASYIIALVPHMHAAPLLI